MEHKDGNTRFILRWDWLPDHDPIVNEKTGKWVEKAVMTCFKVPGVKVYSAHRNAAGAPKIISSFGFDSPEQWSKWYVDEKIQQVLTEAAAMTDVFATELWGPSPLLPQAHHHTSGSARDGQVTYVVKWNVFPGKDEEYRKWVASTIDRAVAVPGILGIQAFRTWQSQPHVIIVGEFADFAAWAQWYSNSLTQDIINDGALVTCDSTAELWGPVPGVKAPIRPGLMTSVFKLFT